jgi:hypothetical protein
VFVFFILALRLLTTADTKSCTTLLR